MNEVLHALRIKGRASAAELAATLGLGVDAVAPALDELAGRELAVERTTGRRPGWLLTSAGREQAERQLAEEHDDATRETLATQYTTFLRWNDKVKQVCASWQSVAEDEQRFTLLEDLHELHERVEPALSEAGEAVPRFHQYSARLGTALERVPDDPRYLVSPAVDSYHSVWFECHEDFLVSLGRSRSEEGSW